MEHGKKNRKFGRTNKKRAALMKSLAVALISHGKIKTTSAKAKSLKSYIDSLVHVARRDADKPMVAARVLVGSVGRQAASRLIKDIAPMMASRVAGSYVKISALPQRISDSARMAQLEFIK